MGSLFTNSKGFMLPRPEPKNGQTAYGVKDPLGGQMFVFSFHVMSSKEGLETRCYMYFGGECLRFYPNDIFHIIPTLFENPAEVHKHLRLLYDNDNSWKNRFLLFKEALQDNEFEKFYRGLVGDNAYPDVTDIRKL